MAAGQSRGIATCREAAAARVVTEHAPSRLAIQHGEVAAGNDTGGPRSSKPASCWLPTWHHPAGRLATLAPAAGHSWTPSGPAACVDEQGYVGSN